VAQCTRILAHTFGDLLKATRIYNYFLVNVSNQPRRWGQVFVRECSHPWRSSRTGAMPTIDSSCELGYRPCRQAHL